jgi:hypothetical protein
VERFDCDSFEQRRFSPMPVHARAAASAVPEAAGGIEVPGRAMRDARLTGADHRVLMAAAAAGLPPWPSPGLDAWAAEATGLEVEEARASLGRLAEAGYLPRAEERAHLAPVGRRQQASLGGSLVRRSAAPRLVEGRAGAAIAGAIGARPAEGSGAASSAADGFSLWARIVLAPQDFARLEAMAGTDPAAHGELVRRYGEVAGDGDYQVLVDILTRVLGRAG